MDIEISGAWYKTIYDDSGQCHNCCARNDSSLCAGLSAIGDCANNLFVFQPKEFNQPVVNSTAEATSVLNEPKTDQNTIVWVKQEVPGMKYSDDKIKYTLIPPYALQEVARNLTVGLRKYAKNNWQKVPNAREKYLDALMRHLESYRRGSKYDPENHEPDMHELSAVIVNAMFLLEFDLNPNLEEVKE